MMNEQVVLKSADNSSLVTLEKGELVSYKIHNEELIHQKGMPGWRNSDTEMFPLIGPTEKNNFLVSTPKGNYSQDQHGLLRELKYKLENQTENTCVFIKKYAAYIAVENSKFPEKSTARLLSWPYSFTFRKIVALSNESLTISFEIESEKGMPFMLGYHPAFKLEGHLEEIVMANKQAISIPEIQKGGDTAYPVLNTAEISLVKKIGFNLNLKTKGFHNFMLWTPASNMLCIEPITAYPYTGGEILSKALFNASNGIDTFEVLITPYHL
jgi:hypothetical protein